MIEGDPAEQAKKLAGKLLSMQFETVKVKERQWRL